MLDQSQRTIQNKKIMIWQLLMQFYMLAFGQKKEAEEKIKFAIEHGQRQFTFSSC